MRKQDLFGPVRRHNAIGVQEGDYVSGSMLKPDIPRIPWILPLGEGEQPHVRELASDQFRGSITTAVDENDLVRLASLLLQRTEATLDRREGVVRGDYNR